ncbi:hypothetical protein KEG38_05000 [Polyangium jinanense]|uniref:hypothetical protein n=1 Tax=Polyangium jinanense TaxID=2829994 RepID=UPI002340E423|nr:hypothetical protein [Polyangium jinanense]MDC3953187.1 hypothetical protein [Polyangium jinanense]
MFSRVRPRRTLRLSIVASTAMAGGALTLLGASLFGCGTDTSDVFQTGGGSAGAGNTTNAGPGGSGGQGGGGQGGGGGGQGGAGAGMSGSEDCLDGADNDGDGDVDCADADCTEGFTCVDEAPAGWSYTWTAEGDATPTSCEPGFQPEELFTDPAGAAECSACTCGDLQGAACSTPGLQCHTNSNNCFGGGESWSGAFQNGACAKPTNLLGFAISLSCRLNGTAMVTSPGSCPPSVSDFQNKEPFAGKITVCDAKTSNGGCGAGSACAPKPAADTESLCLRQEGEHACPNGFTQVVSYKSATDTRACSACACESDTTCTGGQYVFYDLDMCVAEGASTARIAVDSNTCRNVSGQLDSNSWSVEQVPAMPSGSCTPTGGAPTGEVTPEGAVTFCCK